MDIYGIILLINLYILTQNNFSLVKCVVVTSPALPASELESQAQGISLDQQEFSNLDDLEFVDGSISAESPENSDHNESSDEDSYETKEEPPVELPSSIKITTEGIAYVNAINQFKVYKWTKNNCDFYKVEFDDEVKCTNVEVDNSTIWKYAGGYRIPLTILYEPNASLLLKFYDGYLKYDKAANTNKWISECDIKLYTTDPFDITKTIKLNDTQYTTTKEGSQYSFVFQPGVECDEVRFVEKKPDKNDFRRINVTFKTVWKRWSLFGFESPTNDYFPTAIKYKNRSRVILVFPNGILIRERDMNNDWHTLIDEIKMYTFHPKNPDEIIEMDHSHFLNKTLDGPIHFEFKPKVKCVKVKVDDEVLWTPEHRSTPNRYPTELNYGKYISRLTLRFDSSSLVFFKLRGDWTSYTKENETDVNCLSSTVDMDGFSTVWPLTGSPRNQVPQSISTDFYSFGIGWDTFGEFIDQEVYNTNDPWSFPTGWHTYDYGGVEREPKPQKNALEHLISDIDFIDSSDTRTPISSSSRQIERLPIQIVDGVNRVVRAKRQRGIVTVEDPSAHAPEGGVSTDVDDIPFTHHELIDLILNMNEELERLKKDYSDLRQQLETASTQGKRIPITLDISVKESTNQVTCSKEGVNVVFTPLLPYTFKMIKRSQMVIWHTLRPTEYSVKVVLTPNDKVIVHRVDEKREEMEIKAKNEQVLILNDNTPPLKGLYDDEELEMESNFIMGLRRAESFTSLNDGVRKTDHLVKNDSEGAASDSSVGSLDFFDIDLVDSVVERRPNEFRGQQPKNSEHLDDGERLLIQYIEQTQQPQQSKMAQTAEPLPIETQEPRELQIQLIILELTDRRSSEYVTYEANHIKRREKFTCIPPYRVLRVVHNGQLVWSSSNENYPDRVLVKPGEDGNPMAYMFLPGDFVESVDDGPDVEQVEQLQSLAQDSTPVQEKLEQVQPLQPLQQLPQQMPLDYYNHQHQPQPQQKKQLQQQQLQQQQLHQQQLQQQQLQQQQIQQQQLQQQQLQQLQLHQQQLQQQYQQYQLPPHLQQQFQSPYPYGYPGQQGQFPGYPAFSAYPGLPQVPGYPAFPGQPQYPGITGYPVQPGQMPAQPGQMYPGALGPTQPVSEAEDPWADILLLTKDQNNKSVLLHQDLYDPKAIANNVVQYALAQHARCTSIRSGKKTIWKHYPQEYGDSFPQTITHNKNTHKISIHFKEFIILYQRDTDGKWNDTEYDLRLFTVNPRDRRSIIEMDSTQYHLGKVDDEKYQFTFRDGVRCAEVHIDEQIVWKHGEFSMQDPLMVSYHEQLDEIAVGNEQKLLVYYKLDDGWPFYRTKYINGHRRPITGNTNRDRGLPYTSSPGTSEEEIPQG